MLPVRSGVSLTVVGASAAAFLLVLACSQSLYGDLLIPTTGGTSLMATNADDVSVQRSLGMTGTLFGVNYTQIWVNSNGGLIGAATPTTWTGQAPPFPSSPPGIYGLFNDLVLTAPSSVLEIPRPPRGREEAPVQISRLLQAHEIVLVAARSMAKQATASGDDGTNDLIVSDLIRLNETQVWFLSQHVVDVPLVHASNGQGQGARVHVA